MQFDMLFVASCGFSYITAFAHMAVCNVSKTVVHILKDQEGVTCMFLTWQMEKKEHTMMSCVHLPHSVSHIVQPIASSVVHMVK